MPIIRCDTYPLEHFSSYTFVVLFCRYKGSWLFCRHKKRTTWETAGGHIEQGETPLMAAERELYEETGALKARVTPLFDYDAADEQSSAAGVVFLAEIEMLGPLPEMSEMAEVCLFADFPTDWTYPGITPVLIERMAEMRIV